MTKPPMEPADPFEDPSGHRRGLATHEDDPTPAAMARRQEELVASHA